MTIQQIAIFACILITIYFIWKLSQVSPIGLVLEAWDCLMAFLANRSKEQYKKHEAKKKNRKIYPIVFIALSMKYCLILDGKQKKLQ